MKQNCGEGGPPARYGRLGWMADSLLSLPPKRQHSTTAMIMMRIIRRRGSGSGSKGDQPMVARTALKPSCAYVANQYTVYRIGINTDFVKTLEAGICNATP